MKTLVVYDSQFGNTLQVAEAMSANCQRVTEVKPSDLNKIDLLIIGSPTQGGRPTPAILAFINQLSDQTVKNLKFACFDTGFDKNKVSFLLKMLINTIGYAAPKIAAALEKRGGLVLAAETFFVESKQGPMQKGELNRASVWIKNLV